MEFPSVNHLLSATFDPLNYREPPGASQAPPIAPQPVASGSGLGGDRHSFESGSQFADSAKGVGKLLNVVA